MTGASRVSPALPYSDHTGTGRIAFQGRTKFNVDERFIDVGAKI